MTLYGVLVVGVWVWDGLGAGFAGGFVGGWVWGGLMM